ncbi:MAG: M28 family peptidase [Vampirovibrionales bacterium]|nr:M28 family peptidase [Vampirovibrionales bacterium]
MLPPLFSQPRTFNSTYPVQSASRARRKAPAAVLFGKESRVARDALSLSPPENLMLNYFIELAKIASPSGQEDNIRNHLISRFRQMGLEYKPNLTPEEARRLPPDNGYIIDDMKGNLVISFPGILPPDCDPTLTPEVVINAGHMDTVSPCKDDITPILTHDDASGEIKVIAPAGYVLGADDKAALAPMMLDILNTQRHIHEPRPTKRYIITVGEEAGLKGARELDPAWVEDASSLIVWDHADDNITQYLYNEAFGVKQKRILIYPTGETAAKPSPVSKRPDKSESLHIETQGQYQHVSEMTRGGNAVKSLLESLGGLLAANEKKDPKQRVDIRIQHIAGGTPDFLNTVAGNADAMVQISGRSKDVEEARKLLAEMLAQANAHQKTTSTIEVAPTQWVAPQQAQVNAFTVKTFMNTYQGRKPDGSAINMGAISPFTDEDIGLLKADGIQPKSPQGVVVGFDIRGDEEALKANIREVLAPLKRLAPSGIEWVVKPGAEAEAYYTRPDARPVSITQNAFRQAALETGHAERSLDDLPEVVAAQGQSDLGIFNQVNSTRYSGQKVPGLEASCYHNHQQPGDGKGNGEYVVLSELMLIQRIMAIMAQAFEYPSAIQT